MKNDEWLTPPWILAGLGHFNLDPCAPPPLRRPWRTASIMLCETQDGLSADWEGRVWLNPPFGREAVKWMRRMVMHGDGVALLPARTETEMFFETVWSRASSILFLKSRPHFHVSQDTCFPRSKGEPIFVKAGCAAPANSGAPICLISYGPQNSIALRDCGLPGKYIRL